MVTTYIYDDNRDNPKNDDYDDDDDVDDDDDDDDDDSVLKGGDSRTREPIRSGLKDARVVKGLTCDKVAVTIMGMIVK